MIDNIKNIKLSFSEIALRKIKHNPEKWHTFIGKKMKSYQL